MIVIYTVQNDETVSKVMDWLADHHVLRINNDNLPAEFLNIEFNIHIPESYPKITSIWFRKGGYTRISNSSISSDFALHATSELYSLSSVFTFKGRATNVLGANNFLEITKVTLLGYFNTFGIKIPQTIITTCKNALKTFSEKHGESVIKPIGDGTSFTRDGQHLKLYTEKITPEFIENLSDNFFPILVQKLIKKKYEIRTFYLNGACYSMAVFIPASEIDIVDNRYHYQNNNARYTPYKLPRDIEETISKLMNHLNQNTGSFDIIKSADDDEYYFLEMNPSGQFGHLSYSCNYNLEKEIANFLKNE